MPVIFHRQKYLKITYKSQFRPKSVGEGTEINISGKYPNLKLHFDYEKGLVCAIEGNIGYLVPGKDVLTLEEFQQIFRKDSLKYSDMTNSYMAAATLDGNRKLFGGYFNNKSGEQVTTFVLSKGMFNKISY